LSIRATQSLALGAAIGTSYVSLREHRHIWAGTMGTDEFPDATRDLRLETSGKDRFRPTATVGMLAAPYEWPLELALSITGTTNATIRGPASALHPLRSATPRQLQSSKGSRQLRPALEARVGARYLSTRFGVEANAEWRHLWGNAKPSWQLDELAFDDGRGTTAQLESIDALFFEVNSATIRGAVELQIVEGFLWTTAGYRFRYVEKHTARINPAFDDTGGHAAALGIEASVDKATVILGFLHSFESKTTVAPTQTQMNVAAPFATLNQSATAGQYTRASTTIGLALELSWE